MFSRDRSANPQSHAGFLSFSIVVLFLFLLAVAVTVTGSPHAIGDNQTDPAAVRQTRSFLISPAVGRQVVEYMHFGATYRGHKFLKAVAVFDKDKRREAGYFGLQYRFRWSLGGSSDVVFLCDRSGRIYDVQVLSSNARTNPPFEFANDVIQILGNELLDSAAGGPGVRNEAMIHELEDGGDARVMLTWLLAHEQQEPLTRTKSLSENLGSSEPPGPSVLTVPSGR